MLGALKKVKVCLRTETLILVIQIINMTTAVAENSTCIFCNIVNKVDNTEILYEDEDVAVFRDIKPASRFHILTVPKKHIEDVKALTSEDKELGKSVSRLYLSLLVKLGQIS